MSLYTIGDPRNANFWEESVEWWQNHRDGLEADLKNTKGVNDNYIQTTINLLDHANVNLEKSRKILAEYKS